MTVLFQIVVNELGIQRLVAYRMIVHKWLFSKALTHLLLIHFALDREVQWLTIGWKAGIKTKNWK